MSDELVKTAAQGLKHLLLGSAGVCGAGQCCSHGWAGKAPPTPLLPEDTEVSGKGWQEDFSPD